MNLNDAIGVDFETERAESRPNYPPEPVGVAIGTMRPDGVPTHYYAWGHPTGNNCDKSEAVAALRDVWESGRPVVFHNAKFDLAVAYERLNFPELPWQRTHDTMFLAFLADPHNRRIDLKNLAHEYLDWAPEERDEVAEWIWDHRKELVTTWGGKITRAKTGPNSAGAWLSKAPGGLVGKYAAGDVDRTLALFAHLWPIISREGMEAAYIRERRVLPVFMENERIGMRVDLPRLEQDIEQFTEILEAVEDWMRDELGASGLSFDNDRDIADVLSRTGMVDDDKWVLTKSGQKSVAKDNLRPEMFNDPLFASAFGYRNRLVTCLKMFMQPWAEQAAQRGGYMSTNWHQTRGGDKGGTRTGRPSTSNPNFLNISKSFEGRSDGYEHPDDLDIPPLPLVRKYVLPDDGDVFAHRDFDGQELRVFAHFECGPLQFAYRQNPQLDPHGDVVKPRMDALMGIDFERTKVKVLNFQGIYGGGAPAAQRQLNCSLAEAKEFKRFHEQALPGKKILNDEIKRLVKRGEPITTWGGRKYFVEPPKMKEGRRWTFEYKLLNYLVQGSAADITKEALANWYEHPDRDARFLVTVYDEINLSIPPEILVPQMRVLRECMEAIELDVLMTSSGKVGPTWGELEKYDDA